MSISTLTPSSATGNGDRFHWTVEKFYRASDAGVFDEPKQWELVHGDLWKKEIVNPPHAETTGKIADQFRAQFASRFRIREEKPVSLSVDTELLPDIAVIVNRTGGYGKRHPGPNDILLLVEVADTSINRDTIEKPMLYGQAGIVEYWVSLIGTRELLVFRNPTPDGYMQTLRLSDGDLIRPLATPEIEFAVGDLLVPVESEFETPVTD